MPLVHIEYFAILREQRGVARESITTEAATPIALYAALRARHGFTLPPERIRAAVNEEADRAGVEIDGGECRVVLIEDRPPNQVHGLCSFDEGD